MNEILENLEPLNATILKDIETHCRPIFLQKHRCILYGFEKLTSTMDLAASFANKKISEKGLFRFNVHSDVTRCAMNNQNSLHPGVLYGFLALEQTHGKGRKQRLWHSAPGKGLYITFMQHVEDSDPQENTLAGLSLAIGLAVQEVVVSYGGRTRLKWPNDLQACIKHFSPGNIAFRKLSGVLVDVTTAAVVGNGRVIHVGIGINLFAQNFPPELDAISLEEAVGSSNFTFGQVLHLLIQKVDYYLTFILTHGFGDLQEVWNDRCGMMGDTITLNFLRGMRTGLILGVQKDGSLMLREQATGEDLIIYSAEYI